MGDGNQDGEQDAFFPERSHNPEGAGRRKGELAGQVGAGITKGR